MADASLTERLSVQSEFRLFLPVVVLIAALALVPPLASAMGDPFLIRVFTRIIIFAIVAVALNIILGFGGLVSLMHASLFGIGAYVVAILAFHDYSNDRFLGIFPGTSELLISLPCALAVTMAMSALFGLVAVRTTGTYFIMITLAFNQMIYYFFVAFQQYGGDDGLQVLSSMTMAGTSANKRIPFYYVCLAVLGCILTFVIKLFGSRFGLTLRAISQNERRVVALGIPATHYKLAAFVISGALAGLAGGLWTNSQQFVSPADMSWIRSGDFILIIVLGGIGYPWGPVIGAAAYLTLELVLSSWTTYWQLPFGLCIVAAVVFLRDGAVGAAWTFFGRRRPDVK